MIKFCEKVKLFKIWEYKHCVKDSFYEHCCRIIVDSAVMKEKWWLDVHCAKCMQECMHGSVERVMNLSH